MFVAALFLLRSVFHWSLSMILSSSDRRSAWPAICYIGVGNLQRWRGTDSRVLALAIHVFEWMLGAGPRRPPGTGATLRRN